MNHVVAFFFLFLWHEGRCKFEGTRDVAKRNMFSPRELMMVVAAALVFVLRSFLFFSSRLGWRRKFGCLPAALIFSGAAAVIVFSFSFYCVIFFTLRNSCPSACVSSYVPSPFSSYFSSLRFRYLGVKRTHRNGTKSKQNQKLLLTGTYGALPSWHASEL